MLPNAFQQFKESVINHGYLIELTMNLLFFFCFFLQAAQVVLISLSNLNPEEFSTMLSVLPKTFQVWFEYVIH